MSTASDPSTIAWITAVATLGSAFVGGSAAIGGAWIAHLFTAKRERQKYLAELASQRRERLHGKLEELLTLALDHHEALGKLGMRLVAIGLNAANANVRLEIPPEPEANQLDRASALQGIYFPTLNRELIAVIAAAGRYREFFGQEAAALAADAHAWDRDNRPTFGTRSGTALAPLAAANQALIQSARALIERELTDPS